MSDKHQGVPKSQKKEWSTQSQTEDERGWAGQHGQRPANDEEKNYRGVKSATGSSSGKDK